METLEIVDESDDLKTEARQVATESEKEGIHTSEVGDGNERKDGETEPEEPEEEVKADECKKKGCGN